MRQFPENTYSYKILPLDAANLAESRLNALGAEGWMLASTLPQLVFVRSRQRQAVVPTDMPLMLTIKQASERLNVSRSKFYEFIHSGQIKGARIGRCIRIPRQELEIFIREHTEFKP